jgi:electron transfer flavoprotein alpha subunit
MPVLVIAEHDDGALKSATLHATTAAKALGDAIDVLLMASPSEAESLAQSLATIPGVTRVLVSEAPWFARATAENAAATALSTIKNGSYTHILAAATSFGKNVMPRIAAMLDVAQISDITSIVSPDTFVRPIYAGNAFTTVRSSDPVKVITVRATAFDAAPTSGGNASIERVAPATEITTSKVVSQELTKSERPELASARIVVSGGRGMASGENFKLLEALADRLNAAIGASRAAVDAGFVPNDYQVGQTGKIVAPDLYVAVGISGAIQHLAGMKDSKVIVAINKDPEAPIFQIADYGLVGDLFEIVPALTAELANK